MKYIRFHKKRICLMGTDKYSDFKTLAANEILNRDYKILIQDLGSGITIVAPHGG